MSTRRQLSVAAVTVSCAALAVLGVGSGALASNITTSGQIKACYKTGATLPPLDHIGTTRACPTGDSSLTWNKVGPKGPAGPQGQQGPAGVSVGDSGTSGTLVPLNQAQTLTPVLSTATAPTSGTYYVNASVMLIVAQGDTVACILGDNNGLQGTFATVGPVANQTYETLPLSQAISVNAGDSVKVECSDYTSNNSTSFYDGGITATLINNATANAPNASPVHRSLPPHL
jgi:hypothetical protein